MSTTPASGTAADPFDLQRFVEAQAAQYADALGELSAGRKQSHWIWFIFPQCEGLGRSPMARRHAIRSMAEARAYLQHPVLGARLLECTQVINRLAGCTAAGIFGELDALKFRSSMTLFERAAAPASDFTTALDRYFDGERDPLTLECMARW